MILGTQIDRFFSDKGPKWAYSVLHLKWTDPWAVRGLKMAWFMEDPPMILGGSQIDRSLSGKGS